MSFIERKKQILELLQKQGGTTNIDVLSKKLYTSTSTLRRDLIALENEGIITRHHGWVAQVVDSSQEVPAGMRKMANQEKKIAIAKTARQYLHDHMVIFLDSSSTVSSLMPILKAFKNLTVITNGINIANQLNTIASLKCYICPGILKTQSTSIVGEYTSNFLSNFRAEITFISCKAINTHGIFEGDDAQALVKRSMIFGSEKTILLCDNTKEFAHGYFKLVDFNDIDILISNASFSPELEAVIKNSQCHLHYTV